VTLLTGKCLSHKSISVTTYTRNAAFLLHSTFEIANSELVTITWEY